MKTTILISSFFVFLFVFLAAKGQDSIYKKNKEILIGKVYEISPTEIKYKAWDNPEGPTIVIYASDVLKIRYQNGIETVITPDVLALNQESQIINKTQVIKFSFFTPLNNSICFGYEKMLKMGTNLDVKLAYIGAGYKEFSSRNDVSGSYAKIGVKFLLGQDFYINGLRYVHPLKGRYIKAEFAYSYFVIKDVEFYYNTSNYYNYYSGTKDKTNINVNSGALNIIYGRQFILGNVMTLDYFMGLGYGLANLNYTNKNYDKNSYSSYYNAQNNYYAYTYFNKSFPLTFSAGLSLGFIF